MNFSHNSARFVRGHKGRLAGLAGLLAAGAVAGGVMASGGAAAATGTTAATATTTAADTAATQPATPQAQSSNPVRGDEQATTDTIAATIKTKALASVPGGTVYRIETDAGNGAYEAHMTKADGTPVTVKFDENLNVTAVEDGMGKGDPAPANGSGAPSTGSSSSSSTA